MTLKLYKSYMFRTKDPAIDEFRTLLEKVNGDRVKNNDLREIEESGGPVVTTMRGWFFGKTQRPQNATMEAAGRALGFRRVWVRQRTQIQWLGKNQKRHRARVKEKA